MEISSTSSHIYSAKMLTSKVGCGHFLHAGAWHKAEATEWAGEAEESEDEDAKIGFDVGEGNGKNTSKA